MATICNKIDYYLDQQKQLLAENLNIVYSGVLSGQGVKAGRSIAMSVIENYNTETLLEEKYPALAAAREQYNIIKAMCQEEENDS